MDTITDRLGTMRSIVDWRQPKAAKCKACKRRVGSYRCRVCGTDWCGHCGSGRLPIDERIPEQFWMTACCVGCRSDDPARGPT